MWFGVFAAIYGTIVPFKRSRESLLALFLGCKTAVPFYTLVVGHAKTHTKESHPTDALAFYLIRNAKYIGTIGSFKVRPLADLKCLAS